jgi:proteasome accessory factor B
MPERIDRTERLLNLVICLMASPTAVPRAQIERQIPGYSEAATPSAFERMFERDKDELRSMGIPVETVSDPHGEVLGYRIPQDRYALAAVDLTLGERAAIAVAAQVWGQAVMAPAAGTALRKLETLADGSEQWAPAGLHGNVELTTSDGALLPLMTAIRQDRSVSFDYRAPADEKAQRRTVSPWGLRSESGRWFLVAYDHERAGERTFRVSRVAGAVTVGHLARERQPPADFDIAAYGFGGGSADDAVVATVRVTPGRGAALRRRSVLVDGVDPWLTAEVTVPGSLDELTALVCAAGPDAVVVEPAELIAAVVDAHRRVLRSHSGDGP